MFSRIAAKMTTTRSIMTAATSAIALVFALFFAGTPALASSTAPATAPFYYCELSAAQPHVSDDGHQITAFGSSVCAGTGWQDQKIVVTLEEHLFSTLYVDRAQASTDYSSSRLLLQKVSWDCTGSGTHLFTVETSWYGKDGTAYAYKFATDVSLTCSG